MHTGAYQLEDAPEYTSDENQKRNGQFRGRTRIDIDLITFSLFFYVFVWWWIINGRKSNINTYSHLQTYMPNHWPKRKLDRALSGLWLGRHDQTALNSGSGKKQRRSGYDSSFEPMNTDIYCDRCIIILCLQTICIIPVLLYAMKYVNVVLSKSVDVV